jgi:hypothetical protein
MEDKVKRVLIPIAVTLVAAGAAYGAGRLQGHLHVKDVQAQATEAEAGLQGQVDQARQELVTCTQRAEKLEARRLLHMGLEELNALNFGYAQQHLTQAGNVLASAGDDEAMQALAKELKELKVAPAGQLEQQRQQVKRLIDRFDAAAPPQPQ